MRRALLWPAFLPLIIVSGLLANWAFLAQSAFAAPAVSYSTPGHNTIQQFLAEGQKSKAPHGAFIFPAEKQNNAKTSSAATSPATQLPSAEPPTMKPLTLTLTSTQTVAPLAKTVGVQSQSTDLKGSDGRLEVLVPTGSLDVSHATTAQGKVPTGALTLQVTHLHGNAIGSFNMLGAYQFQVVDAMGQPVQGVVLRQPLTLIYHYKLKELQSLQLDPNHLFVSWPTGQASASSQATPAAAHPWTQTAPASTSQAVVMTNDPQKHILSAQVSGALISPATTSVGTSFGSDQSPPKPNFASVQGNSGNLGYSYPIQMAPGPDGFTPSLQFSYSSAVSNSQHHSVQPAGDEGEGWSIGLGSITSSPINGTTYYSINGIDGVSDLLIPWPGKAGFYETEHVSHLWIQLVGTCFNIWDLSGNYYQLGCTNDSLQYYTNALGRTNYRWDMNEEILANEGPNTPEKKIMVLYGQDGVTSGGYYSIRDSTPLRVQYGLESANGQTFTIAGTVDFLYRAVGNSGTNGLGEQWATAYGTNYQCSNSPLQNTTMRCDDPIQYGTTVPPPTVMSTMMLQKVETFVGDDSSSSHLDYSYALNYNNADPFSHCWDPYTQIEMYCAGRLTLASITPTAYLQGNAHQLQPVSFGYTVPTQDLYFDSTQKMYNSQNQYGSQTWWNYLTSYYDGNTGVGEKISYATAWNNTHGTPNAANGDDRHDPLYCTTHTDCTGTYAYPNDHAWSAQVVTQIQNWGTDSSSSQLSAATTTYQYQLAITGNGCPAAGSDTDCIGDTWLPGGDNNWLAYYDGQFQGFASVLTTSPSGNLTVQHYSSNHGWGSATTDPVNYLSSELLDEEVYSGNSTSGPLLAQTTNTYGGESGTNSAIACDTSVTGTYVPCAAVLLSTRTTMNEGMYGISAPWIEYDYTYDDYTSAGGLQIGPGHYHNTLTQVTNGSNLSSAIYPLTQQWTYATDDQIVNGWTYYDVNKLSNSQTVDKSGHIWGCQATRYDEGVASGVPTPAAGFVTTANTYSSANCASQTSPLTTTYTGYDGSGQVATAVDALGAANPNVYSGHGCTLATAPAIMSSAWSGGHYASCTTYDSFDAQPTTQTNALGQTSSTTYDTAQQDLPVGVTDPNNQVTAATYSYDSNGNLTAQMKQPLETGSYTSRSMAYSTCAPTLPSSPTLPCFDEEKNTSLYSGAVSHTFYDVQGRAVETRTPGPTPGDDTVVMTVYNDQNNSVWQSVPFQVADGSGWIDPNGAKDINGNGPAGTTTFADALGRTIATKDPNFGSSQEPGISCSATLSGNYTSCANYSLGNAENDPGIYATASTIDANDHLSVSYSDVLGQTRFTQQYSGLGAVQSSNALMYSGLDNSSTSSFAYMKVFDLSSQKVTVGPTTTLSYWIYPQSNLTSASNGQNSTCVAVDAYFTDGSDLRDSGAVDQNGNQLHPGFQCGHLKLDQWNYVTSDIGAKLNGKTFSILNVGYDQAPNVGGYRGYIDDIVISNPGSSTPLFATDFENGSPQPTWTNTSYGPGAVTNVGGICCGLTGPEMGTRQEISYMNVGRVVKQTATQYNAIGKPTSVTVTDEQPQNGETSTAVMTSMTYDDLGRMLTMNDPDQGTFSYSYDADSRVLSATQTSGSNSRTIGFNYDLLGRVGCEQTAAPTINATGACSAGNPLVQNTYDTTEIGTQGSTDFPIGQLTQSVATTYFPDGTSATTTDQFQSDQRGRTTTAQMHLNLPASWGVSTALPTYQLLQAYNDADQPTTTSTNAGGLGYTFTQVYDANNGTLTGLSNNGNNTANLATLSYNVNALLSQINFQTSSGGSGLATEQFGYDGNLRPTTTSALWASGSGQNGSLFNQTRSYDNASNVTSLTTTQAQVQGQSLSGGTQTENYCYDDQGRMIWAGNGGAEPGAGNGTCGSGTLGNTLSGAGYTSGYAYTNLGQLWQGPTANGQISQYLYCNSGHPHQLSGIYSLGATCGSPGTALYSASYDPWGNVVSRTSSNVTSTLSYDTLNRMVQWSAGSSIQEQYIYDASGERVLKRSTNAGTTSMTVYAFGLEELQYAGSGGNLGGTSNTYYYSLGGLLIGKFDGTNTSFFITDGLGSVVANFSNTANSAAVLGNQTYEPYGKSQYKQGSVGTNKGYTGQQNDNLSGLDYYGARYYDPAAGQFLSPDSVQGNAQGDDPYSYVGGNPETATDPTGHKAGFCEASSCDGGPDGYGGTGTITMTPSSGGNSGDPGDTGSPGGAGNPSGGGSSIWSKIITGIAIAIMGAGEVAPRGGSGSSTGASSSPGWSRQSPVNSGILARLRMAQAEAGENRAAPTPQTGSSSSGSFGGGGPPRPPKRPVAATPDGPDGPKRMDPHDINFTQDYCSPAGGGYTVEGNVNALQNGSLTPDDIPAIKVFQKDAGMDEWGPMTWRGYTGDPSNLNNGTWYTLDNRRLLAFLRAGVTDIPIVDVTSNRSLIEGQRFKFSTTDGGDSISCG